MRRAGFVLAGGQSRRMGRDKALLPVSKAETGQMVLLQQVAAHVAAAAGSVSLIGSPERYGHFDIECLPDRQPGFGPLSGIHAALSERRADYNLVVACDMPCLSSQLLAQLFQVAESTQALCAAAQDEIAFHPLCAVYRPEALGHVERAMHTGRLRLTSLLDELGAVAVPIAQPLLNCNTPEEWRRFEALSAP